MDVTAANPADRLALSAEIAHEGQVRRSGYIGDKLYSVGRDAIKAVDVADLTTVIAEASIDDPDAPVNPVDTPILIDLYYPVDITPTPDPPAADPRAEAIAAAREHLAARLGVAAGEPLLVTSESAPEAPGAGELAGFRVGDANHWYRISAAGRIAPAPAPAAEADAWNAVAAPAPVIDEALAGDFNRDGAVDQQDYDLWRDHYGDWSTSAWLPADANRDGAVDLADYTVWRDNLGATDAGDEAESAADAALCGSRPTTQSRHARSADRPTRSPRQPTRVGKRCCSSTSRPKTNGRRPKTIVRSTTRQTKPTPRSSSCN